ncbi:hypothetical protein ACFFTN_20855 [Aminobacter aganoensis]|uniref:Uncharacterized protein n=1 Tax=Aminobacter aganoensis TaxID=83264 RepID=A0A7X0KNA7_9HYPH|nr:hypothetical protein [Aminobacter aganoensis]MBB6356986.1 hypothetical protein [Aminobacter aganoensis]
MPPARQAPARLISGNRDMMSARTHEPSPVGGPVPSGCVHVINDRVIDLPDGVSPEIQEMVPGDCQ